MRLFEKFREFPYALDDSTRDMELETFYNLLIARTNVFYEIGDEVGLAIATNVRPRLDANFHLIFFDRSLKGREPLFNAIAGDLMRRAQLRRITAIVAGDNVAMQKFYDRIGLVHEGTLREATFRRGRYYNLEVYGMLREELD